MWWLYIILFIVVTLIVLMGYIKLRYRFWSKQPVFHYYNLWYWLRPPGIICADIPKMNEYVNVINIRIHEIASLHETDIEKIVYFISDNYLRTKSASYLPEKKHIMSYFLNSNHKSFIAIYTRPALLYENAKCVSSQKHIIENEYMGLITARPLNVTLKSKPTFATYYIDNLCVHAGHRKKGIAPKLIQTLYYDITRKNPKVKTYLFKREGEMTAIVPLIKFTTKGYYITTIPVVSLPHAAYSLIEITATTMNLVIDFIYRCTKNYDCVIVPDIGNIVTLMKAEIIDLRAIMYNGELVALYVFRDAAVEYDISTQNLLTNDNMLSNKTIECIGTLCDTGHDGVLLPGFTNALHICSNKYKSSYVLIEETSENKLLTSLLNRKPFLESQTAFFFYNYGCHPIKSEKTFMLY